MSLFYFISDLHGRERRLTKLMRILEERPPAALLIGGDILPGGNIPFLEDTMLPAFTDLKARMGVSYPLVGIILGNDDPRTAEATIKDGERKGAWHYLQERKVELGAYSIYGYSYVPPTPFWLKDWERYDVSRYVAPGSIPPEEGVRTTPISESEIKFRTIQADLEALSAGENLNRAIFLFHTPPCESNLDRAAIFGRTIDHVHLDVHIGSIAVRRYIEEKQPLVTLHGHVHESARLTGSWRDKIGKTHCFGAAHDGPELALVIFDPEIPAAAERELL